MACNCGSEKMVANLKAEATAKDRVISVLTARLNDYYARHGALPTDSDGVPQSPSILLDKPASGITTHTGTEDDGEIPPCPGILLGAPIKA